ncbi:MAG: YceI family protein [Cyclobacteriaceae bacterium]
MKLLFLIIPLLGMLGNHSHAQRYRLASCEVSFYSEAPLENIEAVTVDAQSAFDSSSGEVAFLIPIRGFQFEKALMQEHFNENYLESEKYPNATFEGELEGFQPDISEEQTVTAKGKLTIHGVTREVEVPGTIQPANGNWEMQATFPISVADYKIKIPKVVFYNIAETVDVTVQFTYQPDAQP